MTAELCRREVTRRRAVTASGGRCGVRKAAPHFPPAQLGTEGTSSASCALRSQEGQEGNAHVGRGSASAWGQTGPPQEREHPRRSRFVLTLFNVKNSVFLTYLSSSGAPLPSTPCPKKFSRHFFSNCSPNTPCIYILYVYLCFIPKTSKIFPPSEPIFALPITTYDVERESLGESFPSPRSSNYT